MIQGSVVITDKVLECQRDGNCVLVVFLYQLRWVVFAHYHSKLLRYVVIFYAA